MLLDVFSADVHIAFLYVSDMQSRCGSSSLVCSEPRCHIKIIGRTQSTSPESRLHTAGSEPPSPHHPTIRRVYTGPGSLLGGHACVCSPHHLRGSAARPGLPAGIYWLALCPTAGRLVRSVLTTSAPQRHLWTINSDTKAVGTTAEPTHAANRCFTMRPRRRKLLKHHWQRGFGMPVNGGVIRRALAHCGEKVRTQLHDSARQSNCKRESQWPKEKASNVADSFTFKFDQTPCLFPLIPKCSWIQSVFKLPLYSCNQNIRCHRLFLAQRFTYCQRRIPARGASTVLGSKDFDTEYETFCAFTHGIHNWIKD